MILMNLFEGSNGDTGIENRILGMSRGQWEGETNAESCMEAYTLPHVK